MSKISIEYDEQTGTIKADGDLKVEAPVLPVLRESSKESAKILEDMVNLGTTTTKESAKIAEELVELGTQTVRTVMKPAEEIQDLLETR